MAAASSIKERYSIKRSSLFRIILFIILATVTLIVALIVILFSIIGQDIYIDYKAKELVPKAEAISQQLTRLYEEQPDRRAIARMIYSDEFSVADSSTYIIESSGGAITNDDSGGVDASRGIIASCFDRLMLGRTVILRRTSVGIVVGVPIYDGQGGVIGAVVLIHRTAQVQAEMKNVTLEFSIAMTLVLLMTLIPSILVFHSVTKPISQVADTALAMASGDLGVRAKVSGSFETQHLAESFNTLASALESNIEYLVIERNRLGAVLNGIGEGIIAVDKKGVITHYNSSSVRLLGGGSGTHPAALDEYSEIAELVLRALDTNLEQNGIMNVGESVLSVAVTPIHEDNDSLCGAVALIHDVTESERLEQTRRDYVANVSHELRTPLASIRSLADALNDGLINDAADRQRYYGYILRESIRLSYLIDDLLELSRLQSRGVAFSKAKVELYEIAFDVADRMNDAAQQRGKSIRLLVPEGRYYASTNSDRIEQVLVALTDNAIKHGADGCVIDVRLELDPAADKYVFTVSNPTDEISPSDLDHLFERFYKADRAHTGEGTGLGLAIVSEVLNLLGESIRLDYSGNIISFVFTVSRYSQDGEHPELVSTGAVKPVSLPAPPLEPDVADGA